MKKLSKLALVFSMFMGGIFTQTANAATMSLFNNTLKTYVQPNCTIRREYNDFTKQYTNNEVCNPRYIDYDTANTSQASLAQQLGTSYYSGGTTGYNYYYPSTSYYPNVNALQYYSGSNLWNTPANNYGYLSSSMFNTYYNGGRGDVTGYYDYWGNRDGYDIDYTNGYGYYNGYDSGNYGYNDPSSEYYQPKNYNEWLDMDQYYDSIWMPRQGIDY